MLIDFYTGLTIVILLIFLGFFLSKIKIINDGSANFLSNFILTVALPVAFFMSFPNEFNTQDLKLFLWGISGSIIVLTILILLSQVIFSKKIVKKDNHEYKFAFAFNNTSFIGYPLVSTAFGADGLVVYAGFMLPWVITLFTYGVSLFKKDYNWIDTLKALTNPNVIGIILGAFVFIMGFNLPEVADRTLVLIAALTTPLALFCIGFMLSKANIKTLFKRWQVVFVCLLQLIFAPILTFIILKIINAPTIVISVIVLMQMLPTAATLALFNKKFKIKNTESGEIVTLSTLLSALTVPILIFILLNNI